MNLRIFKIFIFTILCIPAFSLSQIDKQQVGNDQINTQQGGYYNYGSKDKVNIEVNIWGYVKYPGKYLIPIGSTVMDLISFSGGPIPESKLEDIRLFRPRNDSLKTKDQLINLDYNDLLWDSPVSDREKFKNKINLTLHPGDVLIFTGEPRYFTRDNIGFILSISAVLISIGILVVSITK
ncbi:MAG TPA: SLBB domain-containing protein [Ignavibacteria bacterium]|nr:SLBB domain-containing protein [Ignavibacteria bacterium]